MMLEAVTASGAVIHYDPSDGVQSIKVQVAIEVLGGIVFETELINEGDLK